MCTHISSLVGRRVLPGRSCHGGSRVSENRNRVDGRQAAQPLTENGGRQSGCWQDCWLTLRVGREITRRISWESHWATRGTAHTNTRGHLHPAQEGHLEEWTDLSKGRLSFPVSRLPGAEEGRSKWSAEMEVHWPSSKNCRRESQVWNPQTQQELSWKETPADKRHLLGPENAVSSSQESQSSMNIPAPLFSSPSSGHFHPGGVRTQVCNMGKEEKCQVGRGEEAICAPSRPWLGQEHDSHLNQVYSFDHDLWLTIATSKLGLFVWFETNQKNQSLLILFIHGEKN